MSQSYAAEACLTDKPLPGAATEAESAAMSAASKLLSDTSTATPSLAQRAVESESMNLSDITLVTGGVSNQVGFTNNTVAQALAFSRFQNALTTGSPSQFLTQNPQRSLQSYVEPGNLNSPIVLPDGGTLTRLDTTQGPAATDNTIVSTPTQTSAQAEASTTPANAVVQPADASSATTTDTVKPSTSPNSDDSTDTDNNNTNNGKGNKNNGGCNNGGNGGCNNGGGNGGRGGMGGMGAMGGLLRLGLGIGLMSMFLGRGGGMMLPMMGMMGAMGGMGMGGMGMGGMGMMGGGMGLGSMLMMFPYLFRR